jgi:hypothetical protein
VKVMTNAGSDPGAIESPRTSIRSPTAASSATLMRYGANMTVITVVK